MAEVLGNRKFTGSIDSDYWTKYGGSSRYMFYYDATGASHDGGAAKCGHTTGTKFTTMRYSMKQPFTLTAAADIDTATMDAWCQYNDNCGTADDCTIQFAVKLRDPDGNFHNIKTKTYDFGTLTSVNFMSNKDVKTILTTYGNGTWYVHLSAFIYRADVTGWLVGWWDDISLDIAYHDTGTTTDTITLSDSASGVGAFSDTFTDTITLTDSAGSAMSVSADPTFRYYFGSYEGKVYGEESTYKSDDGTSIPARWESKETDFAEESIEALDKFKTIYKIRLLYVDISEAPAAVTISVKPDGGATWSTVTENVGGVGDDTNKNKDFYIIISGNSFKFRVEHDSDDNEFQWTGLEVDYTLGGGYFQ